MSRSPLIFVIVIAILAFTTVRADELCNNRGFLVAGQCECFEYFSGAKCEKFIAHTCIDDYCSTPGTYCRYGNIDCSRDPTQCRNRVGWCLPLID
ncbi:hypothetical protein PFISCL1PPCAC_18855 [Pristionchus fissidentatus]|uniref:Epidermal growth factor-like domain-containing protein n=1 Tax=Pristionchus fissidentatus TaxID=1538716 RepID=A0AAV5W7N6_9BILA|nr:hypothetical protein PFISCL1PPCAC_18855 [Pristionchus fissidentatus]